MKGESFGGCSVPLAGDAGTCTWKPISVGRVRFEWYYRAGAAVDGPRVCRPDPPLQVRQPEDHA